MPQDVLRNGSTKPLHEDAITRVARCIFAYRWPLLDWHGPATQAQRDEALLLAVQFREIFRDRWTLSEAADRLAEQSITLVFGTKRITDEQRKQVEDYAQSYLEDLVTLFMGDGLTLLKNPTAGKGRVS